MVKDEDAFMADLLAGIDESFFNAVLTPDSSPKKKPLETTQVKTTSHLGSTSASKDTVTLANPKPQTNDENLDDLLAGAEDWDWNDMNDDFLTPKKASPKKKSPVKPKPATNKKLALFEEPYVRGVVESIASGHESKSERHLMIALDALKERRLVILKDDWTHTDIRTGDIVGVIGSFTPSMGQLPSIIISAKSNLLILHPDTLLTATTISNTTQCMRKPILSLLLRSLSDVSPALVWGNILHDVMQKCLAARRWDDAYLEELIDQGLRANLNELVKINVGIDDAKVEVKKRAQGLKSFGRRYVAEEPKPDAKISDTRSAQNTTSLLAISKLHDVEEDIWSPKFGLKGKIDASVQAKVVEFNAFTKAHTSTPTPLEIKTGRSSMEHRAQTILYTLLMSDRYSEDVTSGLLYYTQSEEVVRVPAGRNELKSLIMARNEIASYLAKRELKRKGSSSPAKDGNQSASPSNEPFLPPTIDDERTCGWCYVKDACMLYKKAFEPESEVSSEIANLFEQKTGHLSASQLEFFRQWEQLITYEEQDLNKFRKELWTMGAREREERGRCLSSMVIDTKYKAPATQATGSLTKHMRIHQYTYRFIRDPYGNFASGSSSSSLLNGHISVNDPVTLSVEPNLLALARGFVLELKPTEIVVGVDHVLSDEAITLRLPTKPKSPAHRHVFRIDKDELASGMSRVRDNIAHMFYANGGSRLLDLVVDLRSPVFSKETPPCMDALSKSSILNINQLQAVEHVLKAEDYALILGMPGTGKTTTISEVIRTLVEMGKTVLLTSYTHSAVDTILLKLKDTAYFDVLRLGNLDKIHPDIHQFSLSSLSKARSIEQLESQILSPPVVATTCLSIDHSLFSRRKFDYCIIDEASQITLPTCVGPLRFADKFILVGDHFQLPPLVKSREARQGGMDVSLFRRLSDAHPHAVIDLAYQYRMNEDIMLLSNRLIYRDRLKCGSKAVAKQSLLIPHPKDGHLSHRPDAGSGPCWLQRLMDPSCKAIFVDTDAVPANDSRVGDLIQNEVEASLVHQTAEAFIKGGVDQEQIGIISLYRQQIKCISNLLRGYDKLEILTADRSQGRDKDCIIISLVRANDENQIGDLMKDWRRINVAFTRARSKLIIFGSRKTLQSSPLLSEFFALMNEKGWILALPPGAHELHQKTQVQAKRIVKRAAEEPVVAKENTSVRPQKKIKKATVQSGLFKSRPVLRDVMNDVK